MHVITRQFQSILARRLSESLNFIQVVVGPRQIGKTTGVRSIFDSYPGPKHFVSADSPVPFSSDWLRTQWSIARGLGPDALLVIDEVQKVDGWAEVCKRLFDEHRSKRELKVVLLGSASLSIKDGLASALAGRFELIQVPHWSYAEMREAFGFDLDTFISFGGYPGAAELLPDFRRWQSYIRDSVIEPVLGRDISGLVRINKPALFRQSFRLAMLYPAQIISYQKLLGQLQDRGNAATVKHYLELFESAFLLKLIPKFSNSPLAVSKSSPKILPLAPALCNAFVEGPEMAQQPTWRGRVFESVIGAALLKLPGELFYWSHGNYEVDFVRVCNNEIIAYEVKSKLMERTESIRQFRKFYPDAKVEIIEPATVAHWL